MKNKITIYSFLTAIVFCLFVSIFDAQAQTARRKKRSNQTPAVVAAPPQTTSDQYLDGNQIILGENPQQTQATTSDAAPNDTQTDPAPPVDENAELKARIKELNSRIKKLESNKPNEYDEKQKRLLLNLDILSKAETRAESLRKQLFEMVEKETAVRTRLEQIQFDARPEQIERSMAFVGSLRPEEIRDQRKKSLDAERKNLETLLTQIETSRASLEANVEKADLLVEKVRLKLDKEIDDALMDEGENK